MLFRSMASCTMCPKNEPNRPKFGAFWLQVASMNFDNFWPSDGEWFSEIIRTFHFWRAFLSANFILCWIQQQNDAILTSCRAHERVLLIQLNTLAFVSLDLWPPNISGFNLVDYSTLFKDRSRNVCTRHISIMQATWKRMPHLHTI